MLISVVIPCFNVEEYITECIECVFSQTYKNLEVICIDNNSVDKTWDLLLKLKTKYPNLIVDTELKSGANAARNRGLKIATGEWIQLLDADDLLEPKKIEHQIDLIRNSNENVSFVAASYKKKYLSGETKMFSDIGTNKFVAPFINKCGITSSNLWKKKSIENIGYLDESIKSSQETDLMLRLILNRQNYLIDLNPLTILRERESGQISQGNQSKNWLQFIKIRLEYLDNLFKINHQEYELNKSLLFDFLMVSIITLAKYNKSEAKKIYISYVKDNWKSSGNYGFKKFKVMLIKCLGFNFFLFLINYNK